jgi:hypothetical protein
MRIAWLFVLCLALTTSCIPVLADHTLSTQTESFPASGMSRADLETGAGILTIIGTPGLQEIEVRAEFKSGSGISGNTQRILDNLVLDMEVRGSTFYLKTENRRDWSWGNSGWIDIHINMPAGIELDIDDGSGPISISGMGQDVNIKDGSGKIELTRIEGSVRINDGSGEIQVRDARGSVDINDGSGSVDVRHAGGNVQIRDGSGSISVDDVGGNLIIPGDGSGSIDVQNIQNDVDINDGSGSISVRHAGGNVQINDGSGSIDVTDVSGNLTIPSAGSGSVHYSDVRGNVDVPKR